MSDQPFRRERDLQTHSFALFAILRGRPPPRPFVREFEALAGLCALPLAAPGGAAIRRLEPNTPTCLLGLTSPFDGEPGP